MEIENKEIYEFISNSTINVNKKIWLLWIFHLRGVNDTEEGGVELIDEYNKILFKDDQHHVIIQNVGAYRKIKILKLWRYPSFDHE